MAASIADKLQNTQTRIHDARQKLATRGRTLRSKFELRRDRAYGRLRTQSLERLFTLSETSLRRLAELFERASRFRTLKRLDPPAQNLIERADKLAKARTDLHRPNIQNYDDLNVSSVTTELEALNPYQLERIRDYEASNKNRKTVIREIERRLQS